MKTGAWLFAAALALGGCVAHRHESKHPHGAPPGQAKKAAHVDAAHVCLDTCDHVFIEGAWVVLESGHKHGHGCGHHKANGKWVLVKVAGDGPGKSEDAPGKGNKKK